jgi:hypothetical protein
LVLELLRQRGIFCIFSIGFGTVATAWYFFYFFYWFWNCCDSVVFFSTFSIGFGTVATAPYSLYKNPTENPPKISHHQNSSKTIKKKKMSLGEVLNLINIMKSKTYQ